MTNLFVKGKIWQECLIGWYPIYWSNNENYEFRTKSNSLLWNPRN